MGVIRTASIKVFSVSKARHAFLMRSVMGGGTNIWLSAHAQSQLSNHEGTYSC